MTIVQILESSLISPLNFCAILGLEKADLEFLTAKKVLSYVDQDLVRIDFVGLLVFQNSLLVVAPKYATDATMKPESIMRILRKYFERGRLRRHLDGYAQETEFADPEILREYDSALMLRDWYNHNGIYQAETSRVASGGRIDWNATVAKKVPIVTGNSMVYADPILRRRQRSFTEVSEVQAVVTIALSRKYGLMVPDQLTHLAQAAASGDVEWPLDEDYRAAASRLTRRERTHSYRTDSIQLLTVLDRILQKPLAGTSNRVLVFGTTAFYAVWEDACRVLFSQGQPAPESVIGQPAWVTETGQGLRVDQLRQIPDSVYLTDSDTLIFDAKYYYPYESSRPGAPDIIKQLFYAQAATISAARSVRSIFLMPAFPKEAFEFMGYATIHGSLKTFDAVECWGLDPGLVFSNYYQSEASAGGELLKQLLSQGRSISEYILNAETTIKGKARASDDWSSLAL